MQEQSIVLQTVAAATVWAFTQRIAWMNKHLTPEQRDKVLKRIAGGASAVAGLAVAIVGILNDAQEGKVDPVNVGTFLTAIVVMAQVFGISQLLHHARKVVTAWLSK
jgi:cobalamin biosynthesis protein CobD/CbiB